MSSSDPIARPRAFENVDPLEQLAEQIRVPGRTRTPLFAVLRRIAMAVGLVAFIALVVLMGGGGYVDVTGDAIGLVDALYYASVTVTTTGYGDITAVSQGSRLATIVLITPARILFLILVVGTTVEVLTEQSRQLLAAKRWRNSVQDHIVICGYGATGGSAVADLLARGVDPGDILAVDTDEEALAVAEDQGIVTLHGDASKRAVLHSAAIEKAKAVIVAPNRDDTAVLITLTAREINPGIHIVAAGKEQENLHLLRQGGADEVIDATAAVGRMLGLGTLARGAVGVVEDLLAAGTGLELAQVDPDSLDGAPCVPAGVTLVAVVRDGEQMRPAELERLTIQPDDRLIVVREN